MLAAEERGTLLPGKTAACMLQAAVKAGKRIQFPLIYMMCEAPQTAKSVFQHMVHESLQDRVTYMQVTLKHASWFWSMLAWGVSNLHACAISATH